MLGRMRENEKSERVGKRYRIIERTRERDREN